MAFVSRERRAAWGAELPDTAVGQMGRWATEVYDGLFGREAKHAMGILVIMTYNSVVRRRLAEDPELLDALALYGALRPLFRHAIYTIRVTEGLRRHGFVMETMWPQLHMWPKHLDNLVEGMLASPLILERAVAATEKPWRDHCRALRSRGLPLPVEQFSSAVLMLGAMRNTPPWSRTCVEDYDDSLRD
ncbi:hypothetical protein DFJ74DRAFT_669210 [Hyaloraphidium curvatum]|nr:hypothetical protein DFJ74DRAFT_669210 [Hyaloraphidium curvatum]